jgi:hypothetical protein
VVITDPKEISDPLSDALATVARELQELQARVKAMEEARDSAAKHASP